MTTYTLRKGSPASTRTDVVVIGVGRDDKGALVPSPGGEPVAEAWGRRFTPLLTAMGFAGRSGEVVRLPTAGVIKASTLVAVGVGDLSALTPLEIRRAAGLAARNLGNAATVALALPATDAAEVRALVEGFSDGGYTFTAYKSTPAPTRPADVAVLSDAARRQDVVQAFETSTQLGELVSQARDWVNTPPNDLTPALFADAVSRTVAKRKGLGVELTVLGVPELLDLGCGGLLGVGAGSANPPRLLRLDWRPKDPVARIALVGKGITYDSGGLTIKTGSSMPTMKNDMAGAAAVVAAVLAIATLGLPVEVTAYAALAENMISGSAMRPGDVLRMHDGRTVEVTNTDAEGRLVLADALTMAVGTDPDAIVEISTLTGPCVVALGDRVAGLFGDDATVEAVRAAAADVGELVWHLPVPERIAEQVRSDSRVADLLQHNWVRWGSASYAAAFLREFTGEVPFAHLDIAGPAWNGGSAWGDVPAGATGFGVRTLVEYAASLARA